MGQEYIRIFMIGTAGEGRTGREGRRPAGYPVAVANG